MKEKCKKKGKSLEFCCLSAAKYKLNRAQLANATHFVENKGKTKHLLCFFFQVQLIKNFVLNICFRLLKMHILVCIL